MKMKVVCALALGMLVTVCSALAEKEEVSFKSGSLTLKGTFFLPKGDGPFPAVVFVHGSGAETRDNSSYSAKWMASIGYAALTYDKRGTGESDGEKGESNRFSFEDLSNDVVAAMEFLSQQEKVDKTQIGIHAASQGGWVAPLATSKTNLIAFMIIKSASVCSVAEDRLFERSSRLRREGFTETGISDAWKMQLVEPKENDDQVDEFTQLFEQHKDKPWFSRVYGGRDPFSESLTDYRKWYATVADFNSIPYLEQIDIPVYWIFGDPNLDQLGPVKMSMTNLEMLKGKGKPFEIVSYEGQGHNVKERKYELELYNWLSDINGTRGFKFRKH